MSRHADRAADVVGGVTPRSGTDRAFDHPPAPPTSTGAAREIGLDVTRTVALVGVVVMNYHGYLNVGDDGADRSWAERLFHPWNGPLSTRFAATFVLVAGVGVSLLTQRSRTAGDRAAIGEDRWRLVRRGFALFWSGFVLEWIWPGTILFFYGAYFMIAAGLFALRDRWVALIGTGSAVAAAGVSWWELERRLDGVDTSWLHPEPDSPRNLLLRTLVDHTHPVLPWLAFLCAGMLIGRHLDVVRRRRFGLVAAGLAVVTLTALVASLTPDSGRWEHLTSLNPFDRSVLYTASALGSAVAALGIVSWAAERWPASPLVVALQRAGQLTLTLYVAHVLVFNLVVRQRAWVTPSGLDTALVLALSFWLVAIAVAAWWHHRIGRGPLEHLYRRFGG